MIFLKVPIADSIEPILKTISHESIGCQNLPSTPILPNADCLCLTNLWRVWYPQNSHTLLTQRVFGPNLRYMADAKKKKKPRRKAVMVGLGLDSDGHKRLTTGPNFVLMGGSQETHEVMTEKAIKINEKLAASGKRLEDVSHEEFDDIAHSVGLPPGLPPAKPGNNDN